MTTIDLDDVQSIVLRGYRVLEAHSHQHYAYLRLGSQESARKWLTSILDAVTSCALWDAQEGPYVINLGFTHRGLRRLGVPDDCAWPQPFTEGMVARAHDYLGDTGPSAPKRWTSALAAQDLDCVVSVAGPDQVSIDADIARVEGTLGADIVRLGRDDAAHLPGHPPGTEHFGFVDGIGQPVVEGDTHDGWPGEGTPVKDGWARIKAGEFLLGHEIESGSIPRVVHSFQKNGSYFALRKLSEHVAAFRTYVAQIAELYDWSEELVAAKMVGRWRSGAPMVSTPKKDDKDLAADPSRNNDFRYDRDGKGHACPFGAHIRRANPRDDPTGPTIAQVRSHRIIRRALPYGPWLPEGTEDDVDRGVMFGVINADLENQFEYVQRNWMNSTISSRSLSCEEDKDPLVGANDGKGKMWIPGELKTGFCWDLPRFVDAKGGAYFFVPSMRALRILAEGA